MNSLDFCLKHYIFGYDLYYKNSVPVSHVSGCYVPLKASIVEDLRVLSNTNSQIPPKEFTKPSIILCDAPLI